jgi:hypothetical protein
VRGPGRVHPGSLLAVGLGCVDGPKQPQPVALCLSRDGGPPLGSSEPTNILRYQEGRRAVTRTSANPIKAKFTGMAHLPHSPGPERLPYEGP